MSQFTDYIIQRSERLTLPVLTYPGAMLTGVRVRDLVTDATAQYEAQAALHQRYRLPVVQTCMDLSVEAETFGCELMMNDDDPPTVVGRLVTTLEATQKLPIPDPAAGRGTVYLETVRRLKTLPEQPFVLAGMIGPFSLAGRLYGVSESLELTMEDPDLMHLLLDKTTRFLTAYAQAFKAAGADGVIMAEPTAGLLSPRSLAAYSSTYIRQIVTAVDDAQFNLVYHNCAAKLVHLPCILETGAKVMHFGPPMDVVAALAKAGPDVIVCGNLDPTRVLLQSTPAEIRTTAEKLRTDTAAYRNFVLSSGCDIPARTPLENVDAMMG